MAKSLGNMAVLARLPSEVKLQSQGNSILSARYVHIKTSVKGRLV
jgi:hypothetical protein